MPAAVEPIATTSLASLVRAAARGDADAFGQLYETYARRVYNLVLRSVRNPETAEDVCQEVWVKAHAEMGRLREPGAFATWLYRIASRACVDRARKVSAQPHVTVLEEYVAGPDRDDPERAALRSERERLVWEALGTLPVRQHLCLYLREVDGRSYREIAEIMETSESAVETLLFRARRGVAEVFERLQAGLEERCGHARRSMAVLLDGEATPVQRRAVSAHVDGCSSCRDELGRMRGATAAYGALPFLPVPALLGERIFEAIGLAGAGAVAGGAAASGGLGAAGGGSIAKLVVLAAAKVKLLAATATLTAGITAASVVVAPSDTPQAMVRAGSTATADEAATANSAGGSPAMFEAVLSDDGLGIAGVTPQVPLAGLLDPAGRALPGLESATGEVTETVDGAVTEVASDGSDLIDRLREAVAPVAPEPAPDAGVPVPDAPVAGAPLPGPGVTEPDLPVDEPDAVLPPLPVLTATPPLPLPDTSLPEAPLPDAPTLP